MKAGKIGRPSRSLRELPNYRPVEAAHYLRVPLSTLRWWVSGQTYRTSSGLKRAAAVVEPARRSPISLSFINLVELHVLEAIRHRYHVRLPQIRTAVRYVATTLGVPHPLANERFETDGVDLFVRRFGELINASRDGQIAIAELLRLHLRRVEHDQVGLAVRLFPFTRSRHEDQPRVVVIDPAVAFGRPVIAGTGIATASIVERYRAGESIADLAEDYERPVAQIEEALRCELPDAA